MYSFNLKSIYIGPAALIAIWFAVSHFGVIDQFFLPGPMTVFSELFRSFQNGSILPDIASTFQRISISFLLASLIGVPVGLILGRFERIYKSIEFLIDVCRSTPSLAVFPLFLVIFGITDTSKIAASVFSATFLIIFNVAYGVMHQKKSRLLAIQIMGATSIQAFTHVVFWESLPQAFVGLRNAMGWIIGVIIATEMFIGTQTGLGHRILDNQITYNIPAVYTSILTTAIIGYLANLIFVKIEQKYLHWNGK